MPSERIQRRIERFLDDADEAAAGQDWAAVAGAAGAVRSIDEADEDALAFLKMAEANGVAAEAARSPAAPPPAAATVSEPATELASFAGR